MSFESKVGAGNLGYPATNYGATVKDELGNKGSSMGTGSGQVGEKKLEYIIDLAVHSAGAVAADGMVALIPARSTVTEVDVKVLGTLSGGTNLNVGTAKADATVVDADGLVAAYTGTAVGAYHKGAGAQVGTDIGADDVQVYYSGSRTAGKFKVTVKYIENK